MLTLEELLDRCTSPDEAVTQCALLAGIESPAYGTYGGNITGWAIPTEQQYTFPAGVNWASYQEQIERLREQYRVMGAQAQEFAQTISGYTIEMNSSTDYSIDGDSVITYYPIISYTNS